MIALYKALTSLLYVFGRPFWTYKANHGSRLWQGRLLRDLPDDPVDIWLHAASAGETRMIAILVAHLLRLDDSLRIHLTVMTEAGHQAARQVLGDQVSLSYFPMDLPSLTRQLVARLQPRVIGVAETEIWPNMIAAAEAKGIPMVLVNGRMSERAYGRYTKVKGSMTRLLQAYRHLFLRSETDQARFAEFGVGAERATVVGDMKFDAPLIARSEGRIREIRFRCGVPDGVPMLVAGSTRPGEEALLLDIAATLWGDFPELYLVLAPRHLERLPEVIELLNARQLEHNRYSEEKSDSARVILVDRMGLLNDLYLAADIAFVGGTLVDIGGHNLLEPVWAGTPVLFGPSTANVTEAAAYIEKYHYGARVTDSETMTAVLREFFRHTRSFEQKTETDLEQSPTAEAGRYILRLVRGVEQANV